MHKALGSTPNTTKILKKYKVIHNKKKANSFEHGTSQIINGS
jgi:hypothetical protein